MDHAEERISAPEGMIFEIAQSDKNKEKTIKKTHTKHRI